MCRDGYKLVFESNKFIISKFGLFIGKGYNSGGLFRLSILDDCNVVNNLSCSSYSTIDVGDAVVWHSRLCHINFDRIGRLCKFNLFPNISIARGSKCQTCVQAKQTQKPFKSIGQKSLAPLDLIHSDLCEMNGVLTKAGKRYMMTLIDDATKWCYIYLVKTKDEALSCFKIYKAEVENQLEKKIKRLRSDRGGEHVSHEFAQLCAKHGIIHEITPPYSPKSNGVAERKNRTLTNLVNAMLDSAGLTKSWWGEAALAACYTLNRVPSSKGEITPYEGWKGHKRTLRFLRAWGCFGQHARSENWDLKLLIVSS